MINLTIIRHALTHKEWKAEEYTINYVKNLTVNTFTIGEEV